MSNFKPSNCGVAVASIENEGKEYFFTPLDFLTEDHLMAGLYVGGKGKILLNKHQINMDLFPAGIGSGIVNLVEDCNVHTGSKYCGPELQKAKELGTNTFLAYMNMFTQAKKMYVYEMLNMSHVNNYSNVK